MVTLAYLPLLISAVFGLAGPGSARRLPPQVATWLLSGGGLVAAAGSTASLSLLAFWYVAQTPVLADQAQWSDAVLRTGDAVSTPVGLFATVAVLFAAVRVLYAAVRRSTAVLQAHRLAHALPDTGSELSVIDAARPQAFAVPGRPGRIVVTTGLLRTLDATERRAVLAHERSHLDHHHHLHHSAAHLSAAVNPLLARLPAAVELSCERWADEDAAHTCSRDTVADALTRAATSNPLSHITAGLITAVLAVAATDVADRVRALRAPAPRLVVWRLAVPLGLLAATTTAVAVAMHDTESLFELARTTYRARHR